MARYGLSADAINGLIEAAVGGAAATQVVQGERTFDLVVRLQPQYRATPEQIGNILLATPDGQQIPLREVADVQVANGAAFIYRQDNSRYIGVQYSVEGRDLASAVAEARAAVDKQAQAADRLLDALGRRVRGVHGVARADERRAADHDRADLRASCFVLYHNFKFPLITVVGVILSAPLGGLLAMLVTGTPFSVSSMIGFLALFGVSVQTAVVYISYANELRLERLRHHRSDADGGAVAAAADHDDRARRRARACCRRRCRRASDRTRRSRSRW